MAVHRKSWKSDEGSWEISLILLVKIGNGGRHLIVQRSAFFLHLRTSTGGKSELQSPGLQLRRIFSVMTNWQGGLGSSSATSQATASVVSWNLGCQFNSCPEVEESKVSLHNHFTEVSFQKKSFHRSYGLRLRDARRKWYTWQEFSMILTRKNTVIQGRFRSHQISVLETAVWTGILTKWLVATEYQ